MELQAALGAAVEKRELDLGDGTEEHQTRKSSTATKVEQPSSGREVANSREETERVLDVICERCRPDRTDALRGSELAEQRVRNH